MNAEQHLGTVEKGLIGTFVTSTSVAVSIVAQIEVYLRIAGLLVGLAIGVVTLLSVLRDYRRKGEKP